jgi:hypothetical protein
MNVTEANKNLQGQREIREARHVVRFDLNHLTKCGLGFDCKPTKQIV